MTSSAIAARGGSKKVAASGVEKEDGRKRKPKKKPFFLPEGKQNVSSRRARCGAGGCGAGAGADTAFSRGGSTQVAASDRDAEKEEGEEVLFLRM